MTITRRIRIAFALPLLVPDGGAERVVLTLIRHLDRRRFEPTLIVLDGDPARLRTFVPEDVGLVSLSSTRVRYGVWRLVRSLHAMRPDLLFCAIGHLNLMVAIVRPLLPRGMRVVARETNVVSAINADDGRTAVMNALYRRFYPRLDHVICQSQDMFDDLIGNFGLPSARASVIMNPVDLDTIRRQAGQPLPCEVPAWRATPTADAVPTGLRLLAIGRLQPQKGFDLLLQAIAELPAGSVRLAIIGQGDEDSALRAQARRLGLGGVVSFLGFQSNPYAFIARADALVSSSRYEGLPNVVLEALACGKPVIATPAPGGLREIAARIGGVRLASRLDAVALAQAIREHLHAPTGLPPIAIETVSLGTVMARYQALLEDLAG
ncbi:MAG: glycosyltransferase [Burkholderiaceae bacterium]